jgi:Tol biopolymer transport system component
MIGSSLSHYRITEKLGAGGMGEVYRAEDTNLNRHVAIKVLPDMFSGDPERLARFEREAKLLASLNHPNIAAIYGLEEAGGKRFLVLELVEGETLAQRIAKGPLPVDETLDVCRQIAEGLEAAHEKGIIHRDLKPANVKITPEGKVKVLDFGLAKAFQGEMAAADASHSPTLTDQMTRPGVILGTAAYMSPEQAKGKTVDKRADIWAFGCVLYECLAGKRAFEGETVTETLAAILKGEPDWGALPPSTSEYVRDVLRRCLQKDPKLRLHDIADARLGIEEAAPLPSVAGTALRRAPLRWALTVLAVATLAGISADIVLRRVFQPSPPSRVVESVIQVEQGHWLAGNIHGLRRPTRTAMAFSHDGQFVVYSAIPENPKTGGKSRLFLRRLDQMDAKPIAGTEGGSSPFISPDDQWVGFWSDDKRLMRVPVEGGTPVALCDALWCFGAAWGKSGLIVLATNENTGLSSVSANGGDPAVLTVPDRTRGEYGYRLPTWLPNDAGILFTIVRYGHDIHPQVAVLSLPTKDKRVLMEDAADARYVPTGHLIFVRRGVLYAAPFDLAKLQVSGQPQPVADDIMQSMNTGSSIDDAMAAQFSFSDSGNLIFAKGGIFPDSQTSLVWVDFKGASKDIAPFKAPFFAPRLAPDGRRIAYWRFGLKQGIWTFDPERDIDMPLTPGGYAEWPIWTPDGNDLTFGWTAAGPCNIFQQPADGSRPPTQIAKSEYHQDPGSWSKDGRFLAFVEEAHPQTDMDILIWDAQERRVIPFMVTKFEERYPEFFPDGHWIAYSSDESGRHEVYVQPFPGPGAKHPVSNSGGTEPLWSRNGKQLFYRLGSQVWVADVMAATDFSAGKPRMLFDQPGYIAGNPIRGYDISLDGQKFLMVKAGETTPTPVTEMILVQNWFGELKRLVPTGK